MPPPNQQDASIHEEEDFPEEEGEDDQEEGEAEQSYESAGDDDNQQKRPRVNLAKIRVPVRENENSIIFSYHYKYDRYLRMNKLLDPAQVKK